MMVAMPAMFRVKLSQKEAREDVFVLLGDRVRSGRHVCDYEGPAPQKEITPRECGVLLSIFLLIPSSPGAVECALCRVWEAESLKARF